MHCRNSNKPDVPTKGMDLDEKAKTKEVGVVAL